MKLSDFVTHARSIARAFFFYRRGFLYLYMRYIVAPRIFSYAHSLEKPATRGDFSMHMFVGTRDFLMGMWSLASLYHVSKEIGELVIHSDGTLTSRHRSIIARLFPSARIEDSATFFVEHPRLLDDYPLLRNFRETYRRFQIRIIDQHFLSKKTFRLFLDSDLLWFREPTEITSALAQAVPRPLMMSNGEYIRMEFKDGSQTDDATSRPNGGLVLYKESQFDMQRASEFLEKSDYLNKRFGDQAWMAWTLQPTLFPEDTYIIKGTLTDRIIMRHYTAPQREKFFLYGLNLIWKDILQYVRH